MVKSPYLSEKSSDFDETWYITSDIEPDDSEVTKNWNFYNSRWWRPPSWKSVFWPLLINRLSDFSEILYEQAERHVGRGYRKFLKSKMADSRHFENRQIAISQWKIIQFWWNSVHYSKCWTRLQSRDQKLNVLKFKTAATAILNIVISPYLRKTVIGFLTKFGVLQHILNLMRFL